MKGLGHILLAVLLGLGSLVQAAEGKSPSVMLQEALYQEQTEGNLDKAIELYSQVIEQAADVERVAARATYQLGLCHLKKDNTVEAAKYFQQVISQYPRQTSAVKKSRQKLEEIEPAPEDLLFEQLPASVLLAISNMYGQVCSRAGMKQLYTNSNIHFVNSDFVSFGGGYGYYTNRLNMPLSQKVRLSSTSFPKQSHYDISGRKMNTEIIPDEERSGFYHIYWTPDEPLPPGQFYMYGWCGHDSKILPEMPVSSDEAMDAKYLLTMQNYFGSHAFEVFFLVIPNALRIAESSEDYTDMQKVDDYSIYAWEKEVQSNENHLVTAYLAAKRDVSQEEMANIVEKAVLTISTCAESDPRVKTSLKTLEGLDETSVVSLLNNYLDSEKPTIRRSAIYILWMGGLSDVSAAEQKLIALCDHEENFTRGMAALALGQNKIAGGYDALVDMTQNETDAYARRCGAYALGLFGDPKAVPVLEEALNDPEDLVKQNAQAALTMLTKLDEPSSDAKPIKPKHTQEMYNDIQADGTIVFQSPQQITNHGDEPILEKRFINSDFVQLTDITDEDGNPIPFDAKHEGSIYRYHIQFEKPIMPGETRTYISKGTISGLVSPVAGKENVYRYYMNHSPGGHRETLRIETYLLPEGAEVVSTLSEGMTQGITDGRIELRVEEVISAGGSLLTSFQYKLEQ